LHSHKFLDPLLQSGVKVEPKAELEAAIRGLIDEGGGWIDFAQFMSAALYDPKFGYYSSQNRQIGGSPLSGSDFVTAPELSPAFGHALGNSVAQALKESETEEIWEFGPGTGELARQLLEHLGDRVKRYTLIDVSGALRARQASTLDAYKDKVNWVSELPPAMQGVVIGNEVLDALPVNILRRQSGAWFEQGVTYSKCGDLYAFEWSLRATDLCPPTEEGFTGDYLTEIHLQGEAFIQTLVQKFTRGVFFFIDYGFPEREYYHPQRHMGTIMCHYRHTADDDPLVMVGHKDITSHVNFTATALAAQEAGADVLGYTSQAHFLINSGLLSGLQVIEGTQNELAELNKQRAQALKLINEHEMGELFKVLILGVGVSFDPLGTQSADRTHTL